MELFRYMSRSDSNFLAYYNFEENRCFWSANAEHEFSIPPDEAGNVDWGTLLHPLDLETFLADCRDARRRQARSFCEEYRFRLATGEFTWVQCDGRIVENSEGKPFLSLLITRLRMKNNFDPITGLRYIEGFRSKLAEMTKGNRPWGVLLIGIDDFKRINDLYSYSFGDKVLADFAARLEALLPKKASLFRLDGDGFGIVHALARSNETVALFEVIQEMAQRPFMLDGVMLSLSISGGICRYPDDGVDVDTLYRNARIALTEAKASGKRIAICSQALCSQVERRTQLLETLKECVQNDFEGFTLNFQPILSAESEKMRGCEVLMRWSHPLFPEGVSPYEFMPILESSGLVFQVNKWLLKSALTQCAEWLHIMPAFHMNINFSCAQFEDGDFKFQIMEALGASGVPAAALTLELTEIEKVRNIDAVNNAFSFLRSQGIKIALDDFGTSYSSLSVFQLLSVDELKIDRSFMQRLTYDVTDQILVRQIIELCHLMNMTVCVEGIENAQIASIVRQFGSETFQGFHYDQPLSSDKFERRYFSEEPVSADADQGCAPEREHSMVYGILHPAQSLSMDSIVDNARAGIFQVAMDPNFTFITCNEGYRRMLGYTAREMETKFGNRALGIVHPDDVEYVNEEVRRQLGEGDTVSIEFRVVRSDRKPIWILGTGNVVKSVNGTPSLVVVIVENDQMKNVQIELEHTCAKYERFLNNIPNGMKCVRYDEDLTIDYISPGFLSLMGFTLDEIMTSFEGKYINLIHPDDRVGVITSILEQLEVSDILTMRYRTPCKDGSFLWVETVSRLCQPEEDGFQRAYSSVISVSSDDDSEESEQAISIANRFQAASQQWGDVLFEYDFGSESLTFSENYHTLFKRDPHRVLDEEAEFVHIDDRMKFDEAFRQARSGAQPLPIEVRIQVEASGYHWMQLVFTQPNSFGDDPVSVLGRISDINDERLQREKLFEQSRLDVLTNLLNKRSVESDIRRQIDRSRSGSQTWAMCVIDIDNFKGTNDNFGHLVGDQVILNTATRLEALLSGEGACIGRAGGDEFLAFVRVHGGHDEARVLAESIVDALKRPIVHEGKEVDVSVSVGVALYPSDASDFYDLFCSADRALYLAKAQGKGTFRMATPRR